MTEPANNLGPVDSSAAPIVTILPPIVRDYPLPEITVEPGVLPKPAALAKAAADPVSRTFNIGAAQSGDVEPMGFGRCFAEPTRNIIAADDSDEFLVMDLLWVGGECEEIESLFWSNTNEGLGDQLGKNQHFEGGSGQVASSILAALKGSYDALAGKTHSVISWRPEYNTMDIRALGKWLKVIDPRISPQVPAYTTNPVLCGGHIFSECGLTNDPTSWSYAANYCDESLGGSPEEKRWEIGLYIKERQDLQVWAQAFATYSNCFIDIRGGVVYWIPNETRDANHTVTADDMLEGSVRVTRAGARNVPERVVVHYEAIEGEFLPNTTIYATGGKVAKQAETDTEGDSGITAELRLPGIQTYSRARRIAELVKARAANDLEVEFIGWDASLELTIGDVATITNAAYDIDAEKMVLVENRQLDRGRWRRKYVQYTADSDTTYAEPAVNTTQIDGPFAPPAGPTPTVTEVVDQDAGGNQFSRLKIEFNKITWPYLDGYYVVVESTEPGDFEPVILEKDVLNTYEPSYVMYTGPAQFGVEYTISVKVRSTTDSLGDAGEATAIPVLQPDPSILWDSVPMRAESIWPDDQGSADAYIYFATYWGFLDNSFGAEYYPHDVMLSQHRWLAESSFGAGEYLVKWEPVSTISGAAKVQIDGTEDMDGVWYDLYDDIAIQLEDLTADGTIQHQVIDVTVARDSGDGTPVEGTQRTKRVALYAETIPDNWLVYDIFDGTNGTALQSHTPNVDNVGDGWEIHAGGFEIQGSDLQATSSNSRAVINAGSRNCAVVARIEFGNTSASPITTANAGIIGRAQDANNYWMLLVDDADTASPVLKLLQYTAGTPAVRAQKTLTGLGPLDDVEFQHLRLAFNGDSIVGSATLGYDWVFHEIRCTSSALSNATRHGVYAAAAGIPDNFVSFRVYPIGDQTLPDDPLILWDDTPLTSSIQKALSVTTNIYFYENSVSGSSDTSDCAYWVSNGVVGYVDVIDITGMGGQFDAGDYVIKYEHVSGSTDVYINNSLGNAGTWFDLWRQNIQIEDLTDNGSAVSAVIDVTIATDDGAGAPVSGTEKTKRVTLYANRVD